jgi:hypothetical protein
MQQQNKLTVATVARSFQFSAHNNRENQHFHGFVGALTQMVVASDDLAVKKNALQSLG